MGSRARAGWHDGRRSSAAAHLFPVGSPTDGPERTIRPCGMTPPSPSSRASQVATFRAPLRFRRETPAFDGERARRCVDRAGSGFATIRDKDGARRVPRQDRPGRPVSVGVSSTSTANAVTSVGGRSGPVGTEVHAAQCQAAQSVAQMAQSSCAIVAAPESSFLLGACIRWLSSGFSSWRRCLTLCAGASESCSAEMTGGVLGSFEPMDASDARVYLTPG